MKLSPEQIKELVKSLHDSEMDGQFPNDVLDLAETALALYEENEGLKKYE